MVTFYCLFSLSKCMISVLWWIFSFSNDGSWYWCHPVRYRFSTLYKHATVPWVMFSNNLNGLHLTFEYIEISHLKEILRVSKHHMIFSLRWWFWYYLSQFLLLNGSEVETNSFLTVKSTMRQLHFLPSSSTSVVFVAGVFLERYHDLDTPEDNQFGYNVSYKDIVPCKKCIMPS